MPTAVMGDTAILCLYLETVSSVVTFDVPPLDSQFLVKTTDFLAFCPVRPVNFVVCLIETVVSPASASTDWDG